MRFVESQKIKNSFAFNVDIFILGNVHKKYFYTRVKYDMIKIRAQFEIRKALN